MVIVRFNALRIFAVESYCSLLLGFQTCVRRPERFAMYGKLTFLLYYIALFFILL